MMYILIIILGGILSYFGPWWIIAPVCFAVCYWKAKGSGQAFGISALASISLWLGYSLYLNAVSEINLAGKVAGIFTGGVPALDGIPKIAVIIVIVSLISGLTGGFSGMAGVQVRKFFKA